MTLDLVNFTRLPYFRVEKGSSPSSNITWMRGEEVVESRDGLLYIPKLTKDQVRVQGSGSLCCRVAQKTPTVFMAFIISPFDIINRPGVAGAVLQTPP